MHGPQHIEMVMLDNVPLTRHVGPYAMVLPGGRVSGNARIEDHAVIADGASASSA